jgi:hypothetical protein
LRACAHENFEEQREVLQSSIIIINYCIIIHAYYDYIATHRQVVGSILDGVIGMFQ